MAGMQFPAKVGPASASPAMSILDATAADSSMIAPTVMVFGNSSCFLCLPSLSPSIAFSSCSVRRDSM